MNCEGWSNKAGLGKSSNRRQNANGSCCVVASGRLGLRLRDGSRGGGVGSEMVSCGGGITAWAAARWVSLASQFLSISSLDYSLLSRSLSPLTFSVSHSPFLIFLFFFSFVFLFGPLGLRFFGFTLFFFFFRFTWAVR